MTHAAPTWAFIPNYVIERLQVVQNRTLRVIGRYNYNNREAKLHSDTEIPMLRAYIQHLTQIFYKAANISRNSYIKRLRHIVRAHRLRCLSPINVLG